MGALERSIGQAGWMRGWENALEKFASASMKLTERCRRVDERVHGLELKDLPDPEAPPTEWEEHIGEKLEDLESRCKAYHARLGALEDPDGGRKDRELWYTQVVDPIHQRLVALEEQGAAHEREMVSLSNMMTAQLRREQPIRVYPQKPEELAIIEAAIEWEDGLVVGAAERLVEAVKAYRAKEEE